MACLTIQDARRHMQNHRPWTFALNCTSNGSNKFWLATGRGRNEPVEIHFGAIGSTGHVLVKDWTYLERKVPEKIAKGYVYVDTPFIRVQDAVITAFIQGGLPAAQAAAQPAPPPNPVPATTKPVPMPGQPAGPYSQILTILPHGNGIWYGLDAKGNKICSLTRQGAQDLVAAHPHITIQGLY